MLDLTFAVKDALEYANGDKTLPTGASNAEKGIKTKLIIVSSLSKEIGQQAVSKPTGRDAANCKSYWDVPQHVKNIFLMKAPLTAMYMVKTGANELDTSDKLKDQILPMDSYNKCDRELGMHRLLRLTTKATRISHSSNKHCEQHEQ
ncbi:hypothetical protein PHMEG_0009822 [Phytophthora megakarya]|uniref:Uncharacterized protein n=1 Tax=Phytophthora megakarya TaxID=4795 RepID=A0A225WG52_9STRA|nr:hypothetical protein PHMEG_0009822 [Phytophthora megakarya]